MADLPADPGRGLGVDLAALKGQRHRRRSLVAADQLPLEADEILQHRRHDVALRPPARTGDGDLGLLQGLDAPRLRLPAHDDDRIDRHDGADIGHLGDIVLHLLGTQELGDRRGVGQEGQHRAVLRRDVVEIVRRLGAAAARHVLDDDVGLAGDVLSHVLGHQPGVEAVRPAGAIADEEGQVLALVEIGDRTRLGRRRCDHAAEDGGGGKDSDGCTFQHACSPCRIGPRGPIS